MGELRAILYNYNQSFSLDGLSWALTPDSNPCSNGWFRKKLLDHQNQRPSDTIWGLMQKPSHDSPLTSTAGVNNQAWYLVAADCYKVMSCQRSSRWHHHAWMCWNFMTVMDPYLLNEQNCACTRHLKKEEHPSDGLCHAHPHNALLLQRNKK